MVLKFASVSAVAAIVIATGIQPAAARGGMPTMHDAWSRDHVEVLPEMAGLLRRPKPATPRPDAG